MGPIHSKPHYICTYSDENYENSKNSMEITQIPGITEYITAHIAIAAFSCHPTFNK